MRADWRGSKLTYPIWLIVAQARRAIDKKAKWDGCRPPEMRRFASAIWLPARARPWSGSGANKERPQVDAHLRHLFPGPDELRGRHK